MLEYESLIDASGGFGRYQLYFITWYTLVITVLAPQLSFMVYGAMHLKTNATAGITNELTFWSIVDEWKLWSEPWKVTTITSLQLTGMMLGYLTGGHFSDRHGRKKAFGPFFVVGVCVVALSGTCTNYASFVLARIAIGFCTGCVIAIILVFPAELMPPKWRTISNCISWPIGYVYGAFCAKTTQHWKTYTYYTVLPVPFVVLLSIFVLESPKILTELGKIDEAQRTFLDICRWNKIRDREKILSIFTSYRVNSTKSKDAQQNYRYTDLFYDPAVTRQLWALAFGWFTAALAFYAMFYNISNLSGDAAMNVVYVMFWRGLMGVIVLYVDLKVNWFGRRLLYTCGLAILILSYSTLILFQWTGLAASYPDWVVRFSVMATGCTTITFTATQIYVVELVPTVLRNKGMGLMLSISRLGAILGPQIFLLANIARSLPFLFLLPTVLVNLVLVWSVLPETKHRPLPDMPKGEDKLIV